MVEERERLVAGRDRLWMMGGQMKKSYEILARVFRWMVVGMALSIFALPILVFLDSG